MAYKILMVTMGLDIGGAETHIVELSKQLKLMGHDVIVVSNGGVYVPEIVAAGIRHYEAPLHRRSIGCMRRALTILKRVIREEKPRPSKAFFTQSAALPVKPEGESMARIAEA